MFEQSNIKTIEHFNVRETFHFSEDCDDDYIWVPTLDYFVRETFHFSEDCDNNMLFDGCALGLSQRDIPF